MTAPIIEVSGLTKEFALGRFASLSRTLGRAVGRVLGRGADTAPPFCAIDDISFSVQRGEILGIVGHNGAGKSTLLKILAGISRPTRGSVAVRGKVAPLIEVGAGLVPDMTGRENIFLNGSILGMSRSGIRRRFDAIVDFAELGAFIDTPVKRYSSGMQVRLGFAIATAVDAEILIIDEVLAVGDVAFQRKCFDRMSELISGSGVTMLLVSHNVRQIERFCRRALLLDHGALVADGDPLAVCEQYFELTDRQVHRQRQALGKRRPSVDTGEVIVRSVQLLDPHGQPTETVEVGADIVVRAEFDATEELLQPAFSFGIQTADLFHIAHCESYEQLRCERLPRGPFAVTCRIAAPPLHPGVYALRMAVGAGEPMHSVYQADDVLSFQLIAEGGDRQQALRQGIIDTPAIWSLEAPGEPAGSAADSASQRTGRAAIALQSH